MDQTMRMLQCFRLVLQTHRESLMVQKQGVHISESWLEPNYYAKC